MNNKHIIEYEGKPAFVVVPFNEYQELMALKRHMSDEELYLQAISREEEYFPEEIVQRVLQGHSPIRVYREYRNMSQEELAKKIGKTKQYISMLEKGERVGTIRTLKQIAEALNIEVDMLD